MATPPARIQVLSAFLAIYLIWGSTYLAIRFALETAPPFLMAGARFLLAGAILFAWVRPRSPAPAPEHWRSTALIGALLLLGGNGGVCWAEQRVPSGVTALLVGAMPLWITLLSWLKPGGRRPTPRIFGAILLGLAGVILMVGPEEFAGGQRIDPWGTLALGISTLCWATGSILSGSVRLPSAPLLATAMEMLWGGLFLCLVGVGLGEPWHASWGAISPRSLLAIAYLVVFGSLIGFTAYVWLLRVASPVKVATYAYVNPVVAVVLGWALGGEALSLRILLAALLILGAVVGITTARKSASAS
ncbi:MAG: EamA family transporter [Candidatus Eisenbacteria bacterium]